MTITAKYSLTEAHLRLYDLKKALQLIDYLLTTVEGDNVPQGETCKLQVRAIAREAIAQEL